MISQILTDHVQQTIAPTLDSYLRRHLCFRGGLPPPYPLRAAVFTPTPPQTRRGDTTDRGRQTISSPRRRAGQFVFFESRIHAARMAEARRAQSQYCSGPRLLGIDRTGRRQIRFYARRRPDPGSGETWAATRTAVVRLLEKQHVLLRPGLGEDQPTALPTRRGQSW